MDKCDIYQIKNWFLLAKSDVRINAVLNIVIKKKAAPEL